MYRVGAWMGWLIAGIACLWIATAAAPCHAAETTLWTPEGGLVSVWEAPLHGAQGGHPGGAFLAYAVADAQDLRIGTVQATIGPDRDADPSLTLDPASGHPVLVWSHGDRGNLKIAYARFEAGLWVDVHDLTFGPGDDLLPRIGRSATGSYLFWVTGEGRYLYAPLDLSGGRLFGAPQSLLAASDTASTDQIPLGGGGLATVQGGSDVPVVTGATNAAQVLGGEAAK
ncbi:MAG TPA: hypothetical protein VNL37_04750, partial [Candidatus Polarisedimenticolia bacterium]|nr:hypothetical protein [Candidatus Polarisedimenticolia bacterium]